MRERKFRGIKYHSYPKRKWIYGDLITSGNGIIPFIIQKEEENEYHMKNAEPVEVAQDSVGELVWTNDCVGTPIYEGDDVEVTIKYLGLTGTKRGYVYWDDDYQAYKIKIIDEIEEEWQEMFFNCLLIDKIKVMGYGKFEKLDVE